MNTMKDLICAHPFGHLLDERTVDLMAGCARNVQFAANVYIHREDEPADHFYMIRRGGVALELSVRPGAPLIYTTVASGDVLGTAWVLAPYRWFDSARAIDAVHAIQFDAKCLRDKCERDTRAGYELMKRFVPVLAKRLQAAHLQGANIYAGHA